MRPENQPIQVATAGEALIDMIGNTDGLFEPCIGGAVYNLTRAMSRQGIGTLYLNPLSKDRFGRQLANGLIADGVHLARPDPVKEVTSLAVVSVNAAGHPDYAFYREGVADRATSAPQLTEACAGASGLSVVCTGALALSPNDAKTYLPWLATQRDAGRVVVIDANMRPSVMTDLAAYRLHVLATLQYADVIKVSDEDLEHLGLSGSGAVERARHLLQGSRAKFLALTCGADGAYLLTRNGQQFHAQEGEAIQVVDTVGAGDCFLAGVVVSLLEQELPTHWGAEKVESAQAQALLESAIASASICVQRRGCAPPLREEVRARIACGGIVFSTAALS
jgi:fructokinase